MPFKRVQELMRAGHPKNMAIAKALSEKRKFAKGGMVGEYDDLDGEHERSLSDLMVQGDQPPVANPGVEDMEAELARKIAMKDQDDMYYAEGGLVEPMDGNEEPEVMHDGTEEAMYDEPQKPNDVGHSLIEGIPIMKPSGLSEEAMKAIEAKKKMRRFRG